MRARGEIAREVVRRDDDACGTALRRSDDGRRVQEIAGRSERVDRSRLRGSSQRARGKAIDAAAIELCGHRGGSNLDDKRGRRRARARLHAIDRDAPDTLRCCLRRQQIAKTLHVARREVGIGDRLRDAVRVIAHEQLPFAVIVAGHLVGRRQNLVHRRVEPALDVRADQLAADEQHQDGGHDSHRHKYGDELRAEPGERQRAPPLDDQLDDVAGEDECERRHHREVGGDERVEHDLGEQLRGEAQAIRRDEHRHEHGDEHADADED